MAFTNRIRLPLQLHSAQFPTERTVFRKANGQSKTLSVTVRKNYELETDFMPEGWHQKLIIALSHDIVTLEGEKYLGEISQDGDYAIEWPEGVLHYPTAKAGVRVQVTPFDATNANCQTCQEATQLNLQDDTITGIYGPLQEDTEYVWPLAENDSICCYPATFSITSFNTTYLAIASINETTGEITVQTKTGLTSGNHILLATYRVTCPNGGYDEADVYADIQGSIEGCLAPENLSVLSAEISSLSFDWDAPTPAPADGYYWELYAGDSPIGVPINTGYTPETDTEQIVVPDPDAEYYFQVRSVCGEDVSNWVSITVNTLAETGTCGEYTATYNSGVNAYAFITYEKCNGSGPLSLFIPYGSSRTFCMLQNSPGDPVSFSSSEIVSLIYDGLC